MLRISINFKFMYLYKASLLPDSFNTCFHRQTMCILMKQEVWGFFYLPYCRTNIRKFSICFQWPKFSNSLSSDTQNATSIVSFTSKLTEIPLNVNLT